MKNLKEMTDDMLVTLYAKGNNEAFDELLDRYKSRLFSYIYYNVRNREVAEDLFQEAFTKVIISIQSGQYSANNKFYAWVARIAHNLIQDNYRLSERENWVSNDETDYDIFNNRNLAESSYETQLITDQIRDDVRKLYQYLPASQSEIIRLRFYENLSFKEIAEKLGISINTALGRMRYAILGIRKMAETKGISLTLH